MEIAVHHDVARAAPQPIRDSRSVEHLGKDVLSEFELVCACARAQPTDLEQSNIQELVRGGVEWGLAVRIAMSHRIRPLFYHGLKLACKAELPGQLQTHIDRYQRRAHIYNTFLVQELCRLVKEFEDHDIPSITLKGPVLAQVAYGDIHLREYTDLDVLIPARRFSEAEKLLVNGDYQPVPKVADVDGFRKSFYLYLSGQWPFMRGSGAFNLDLHTRVMPPGYTFPTDFDPFFQRSWSVQLAEGTVQGFAPEDVLLVLCFHGVKNQWMVLKYACDIAELLRMGPELDWDVVQARARKMKGVSALKLGLYLAHNVLDAPLPERIKSWVMRDASIEQTASFVTEVLRNRHQGRMLDYSERVQFQLSVKDTVMAKMRYGVYSLMQHFWSDVIQP